MRTASPGLGFALDQQTQARKTFKTTMAAQNIIWHLVSNIEIFVKLSQYDLLNEKES